MLHYVNAVIIYCIYIILRYIYIYTHSRDLPREQRAPHGFQHRLSAGLGQGTPQVGQHQLQVHVLVGYPARHQDETSKKSPKNTGVLQSSEIDQQFYGEDLTEILDSRCVQKYGVYTNQLR